MAVPVLAAAGGVLLVLGLLSLLPRVGIRRAQDRLAERILASRKTAPALLTRAELVVGRWRRLPGVLAFADGAVSFEGVFGDLVVIPTERIQKIVTGRKLSSERLLFRLEALRITRTGGEETEFVLSPESASAWRSHLGLWAMNERVADAEAVTPGKAPRVST
ncbi:MAG: hypothetical protein M3167_01290 [Acidobacteriota bacterium]|nr:hypothetical protein [Acidobacteriota bacterium]